MTNERLRTALVKAGMTPADLSEQLRVDPKTVERWITTKFKNAVKKSLPQFIIRQGIEVQHLATEDRLACLPASDPLAERARITLAFAVGALLLSGLQATVLLIAFASTNCPVETEVQPCPQAPRNLVIAVGLAAVAAGLLVMEGVIRKGLHARLTREDVIVSATTIASTVTRVGVLSPIRNLFWAMSPSVTRLSLCASLPSQ